MSEHYTTEDVKRRPPSVVLVEALGASFFTSGHLPGAINIPPHHARQIAPALLPDKDARVVVYGAYTATDPLEWWDDETAVELFPAENGVLRFDARTTLATRPLVGCLAVAPEEGARTPAYLASSPEVEGVSGGYFVRCRLVTPSAAARDNDAARRLWRLSEEMTGLPVSA